ncbi:hypothetical protein CsSME_00028073 [Camellia sinensis var. sinensis]
MASFTSTATSSTWPRRMCACGDGPCIVKISKSTKNPGRPYFVCPCPVPCVSWIGWCEEPRRENQGERTKAMRLPKMKLPCNYGLMS